MEGEILNIVLTSMVTIIMALVGFIAVRLQQNLKELKNQIEHGENRNDVQDIAISTMYKGSFNSNLLVKHDARWPRLRDS